MDRGTKVYVPVQARFSSTGYIMPYNITWENGRSYRIDSVSEVRKAFARHSSDQGYR